MICVSKETWDWLIQYLNRVMTPAEVAERNARAIADQEAFKRIRPLPREARDALIKKDYENRKARSEEALRVKLESFNYPG